MATFDFKKAWKKVETLERQNRPRSLVEIISRIERAAIACNLWPEATRAFIKRVKAEGIYVEEDFSNDPEGLLHLAKTIETLPQPMQAVLQLYLAHVYFEHSRQTRWGGSRPTRLSGNAAETLPPWSREKINETLEKLFEKTLAQADALKAESFDDWANIFSPSDFPPECCPTLYDFVILDIVDFYGKTIPDKTLEKGLSLYGNLLDFHHDDRNDDAVALIKILRGAGFHANRDHRGVS